MPTNKIPGKHWDATPLLFTVLLVPLVTFTISYTISLTTSRNGVYLMEYPMYFLSSSIESKPASNVGTFGLSLSCAAVPLTAFIRHARVKMATYAIKDIHQREQARTLNTYALKVVVVAAIAGVGVASFQSVTDKCGGTMIIVGIHGMFALTFFVGGMRYCLLQYNIDQLVPSLGSKRERMLRNFFAKATVVQLIMLGVLIVVAAVIYVTSGGSAANNRPNNSTMSNDNQFNTNELSDSVKIVVFIMSVFEITLLMTFMSTFVTFYDSFSTTSFAIVVMDSSRTYSLHEKIVSDGASKEVGIEM